MSKYYFLIETNEDDRFPAVEPCFSTIEAVRRHNWYHNTNNYKLIKSLSDVPNGVSSCDIVPVGSLKFYQEITNTKLTPPRMDNNFKYWNYSINGKFINRDQMFKDSNKLNSYQEGDVFVKRADHYKSWTGISSKIHLPSIYPVSCILENWDNELLTFSEILDIQNEYRIFLLGDRIVDIRQYIGNPDIVIDMSKLNDIKDEIMNSPCFKDEKLDYIGWSFDIGTIADDIVFLEYHPMISLGFYGADFKEIPLGLIRAHLVQVNKFAF